MASLLTREPDPMRKIPPVTLLLGSLAIAVLAGPARADSTSTNCLVQQAANAAVQRQIALIDAAKVNPSAFFNGPNSCVAANLLQSINLSNLIPDLSGFLTSAAQGIINGVIDAAKRQVCQILDQQLYETIGSINQSMMGYQSSLPSSLYLQLNGSITPVVIPNINGIGTYAHVQPTGFGPAVNLTPTVTRPPTAPAVA
ncbi:MAG: hypothetical protein WAP03_30125, partial [Methylorubrum rhodinum]|uniref:hypothetical protein n=1 Tax=Methylorubrum rhodinum TaxID=29428 RepID=UPI003BB0B417